MASRLTTFSTAALALFLLTACTTQTPAPPPPPPEPDPPTMDVFAAAAEGNIAELAANKHAGADLDALSIDVQVNALTMAAVGDQAEAAQWLLDNGANVNGLNGDGSTALNATAFLGRADVAAVLVEGGVDASIRNWEGQSAADIAGLDWATTEYIASMLQLEVDRETLEAGRAKIIAMISDGNSSGGGFEDLALAIMMDDAAAVKAALAGGADVNARNPDMGSTPLIVAAFMGRAEIAKMLLAAGADAQAMDNTGSNALMVAELDWQTTEDIATALQLPLTNPEAIKKGKAEIAEMLRDKL